MEKLNKNQLDPSYIAVLDEHEQDVLFETNEFEAYASLFGVELKGNKLYFSRNNQEIVPAELKVITKLMDAAFEEYETNLNHWLHVARTQGVKIVNIQIYRKVVQNIADQLLPTGDKKEKNKPNESSSVVLNAPIVI